MNDVRTLRCTRPGLGGLAHRNDIRMAKLLAWAMPMSMGMASPVPRPDDPPRRALALRSLARCGGPPCVAISFGIARLRWYCSDGWCAACESALAARLEHPAHLRRSLLRHKLEAHALSCTRSGARHGRA